MQTPQSARSRNKIKVQHEFAPGGPKAGRNGTSSTWYSQVLLTFLYLAIVTLLLSTGSFASEDAPAKVEVAETMSATLSKDESTTSLPSDVRISNDNDAVDDVRKLIRREQGEGDTDDEQQDVSVIVRLHLVRHGETEANKKNLVLGQIDSPLTPRGLQQAQATSLLFRGHPFWRVYASDLTRTRITARILLEGVVSDREGLVGSDSTVVVENQRDLEASSVVTEGNADVRGGGPNDAATATATTTTTKIIFDKRLREQAKGAREGRDKRLTYDEALELHASEYGLNVPVPLLETEDEVWDRVRDWIDELAQEALEKDRVEKFRSNLETTFNRPTNGGEVSVDGPNNGDFANVDIINSSDGDGMSITRSGAASKERRRIYNVLAVSHSGTLRTLIKRMVGDQLPPEIDQSPAGKDGAKPGMLIVPNLSVTVIDVIPRLRQSDMRRESDGDTKFPVKLGWTAKLVDLTSTAHLSGIS